MILLRQMKSSKTLKKALRRAGISDLGSMDIRRWKNSVTRKVHLLFPNRFFTESKLYDMTTQEVGTLSTHYAG